MSGAALASAAEALAGRRFRLHGRDPATGLDCVGVLAAALARIGKAASLPTGYGLRTLRPPPIDAEGFVMVDGAPKPGDVLLTRVSPCQLHLLIAGHHRRFVHAHAGLKRVVLLPGPVPWPILRQWRLSESD